MTSDPPWHPRMRTASLVGVILLTAHDIALGEVRVDDDGDTVVGHRVGRNGVVHHPSLRAADIHHGISTHAGRGISSLGGDVRARFDGGRRPRQSDTKTFFNSIDENADGVLAKDEIREFVEDVGGSTLDDHSEIWGGVSSVMGRLDTNSDEGIGLKELSSWINRLGSILNVEEAADWVTHAVRLPEDVAEAFRVNSVSGYDFPELVENNGAALYYDLGIKRSFRKRIVKAIEIRLLGLGDEPKPPILHPPVNVGNGKVRLSWSTGIDFGADVDGSPSEEEQREDDVSGADYSEEFRLGNDEPDISLQADEDNLPLANQETFPVHKYVLQRSCLSTKTVRMNDNGVGPLESRAGTRSGVLAEAHPLSGVEASIGSGGKEGSVPVGAASSDHWTLIHESYPGGDPSFIDSDVSPGKIYAYRLTAWNLIGHSEASIQRLTTPKAFSPWVRSWRHVLPWLSGADVNDPNQLLLSDSELGNDPSERKGNKRREEQRLNWLNLVLTMLTFIWWMVKSLMKLLKALVILTGVGVNLMRIRAAYGREGTGGISDSNWLSPILWRIHDMIARNAVVSWVTRMISVQIEKVLGNPAESVMQVPLGEFPRGPGQERQIPVSVGPSFTRVKRGGFSQGPLEVVRSPGLARIEEEFAGTGVERVRHGHQSGISLLLADCSRDALAGARESVRTDKFEPSLYIRKQGQRRNNHNIAPPQQGIGIDRTGPVSGGDDGPLRLRQESSISRSSAKDQPRTHAEASSISEQHAAAAVGDGNVNSHSDVMITEARPQKSRWGRWPRRVRPYEDDSSGSSSVSSITMGSQDRQEGFSSVPDHLARGLLEGKSCRNGNRNFMPSETDLPVHKSKEENSNVHSSGRDLYRYTLLRRSSVSRLALGLKKGEAMGLEGWRREFREAQACYFCQKAFKAFKRQRHHCHRCHHVFCSKHGFTSHSSITACSVPGECVCDECLGRASPSLQNRNVSASVDPMRRPSLVSSRERGSFIGESPSVRTDHETIPENDRADRRFDWKRSSSFGQLRRRRPRPSVSVSFESDDTEPHSEHLSTASPRDASGVYSRTVNQAGSRFAHDKGDGVSENCGRREAGRAGTPGIDNEEDVASIRTVKRMNSGFFGESRRRITR